MKIRTKLILIAVIPVAMLFVATVVFIVVAGKVEQATNKAITADDMTRLYSELSILTYEHHTYGLERARDQWTHKYEELGSMLRKNKAVFTEPEAQDLLKQLLKIHTTIGYLFDQFGSHVLTRRSTPAEAAEITNFRDRIAARLLQELALAVPTADKLHDMNHDRAIAQSRQLDQITILLVTAIAVVVPLITIFIVRSFSVPIQALQAAVARAGAGDLSTSIHSDSRDEIGGLSRGFNDMVQRLRQSDESLRAMNLQLEQRVEQRTAALQESETKYRIVADNTYDWEFWLSPEGRFLYISPSCERLTGYTMEEFESDPELLVRIIHPDDTPVFQQHRHSAVQDRHPVELHFRILHRNGSIRWMAHLCQPVLDHTGAYLGTRGSNRDVTERKRAEEALSRNEATLRGMMNAITESFFLIDTQGICLALNETTAARMGKTAPDILGKSIYDVVPPDVASARRAKADEVLRTGRPLSFEDSRFGRYIHNSMYPVFDAGATVTSIAIFGMDITERRQAEEALRQNESFLTSIIENIPTMLFVKDAETLRFVRFNKAGEELLGYSREDLLGKNDHAFFPKHEADFFSGKDREVLNSKQPLDISEESIQTKFRGERILHTKKIPILNKDGSPEYLLGISEDITERKKSEEALQQNEERLVALLHLNQMKSGNEDALRSYALEEGVRLTRSEGGYLHFFTEDKQTLQLSNWSKGVMAYCSAAKTPHYPLEQAGVWADCVRLRKPVVHNDYPSLQEKKGLPAGHFTLNRHMSVPIIDDDHVVAVVGVGNKKAPYTDADVHQLTLFMNSMWRILKEKRSDAERRLLAAELTRSNRELEHFAYVASHDLQEPIRKIASFTELLANRYKDKLDDKAGTYIGYIVDGAHRMQTLINDLLSFSRVTTRGKEFVTIDCNVAVQRVLNDLDLVIRKSNARVLVSDLPTVIADETQIGQVFQNLIGNAVKYQTKDHAPEVQVSAREQDNEWIFMVRDNGIGIDPRHFDRIFLLFQRLHTREEYSGTGIGLTIVKKIVERHGGRIWVESEPGKGSAFYFTLPLRLDAPS